MGTPVAFDWSRLLGADSKPLAVPTQADHALAGESFLGAVAPSLSHKVRAALAAEATQDLFGRDVLPDGGCSEPGIRPQSVLRLQGLLRTRLAALSRLTTLDVTPRSHAWLERALRARSADNGFDFAPLREALGLALMRGCWEIDLCKSAMNEATEALTALESSLGSADGLQQALEWVRPQWIELRACPSCILKRSDDLLNPLNSLNSPSDPDAHRLTLPASAGVQDLPPTNLLCRCSVTGWRSLAEMNEFDNLVGRRRHALQLWALNALCGRESRFPATAFIAAAASRQRNIAQRAQLRAWSRQRAAEMERMAATQIERSVRAKPKKPKTAKTRTARPQPAHIQALLGFDAA